MFVIKLYLNWLIIISDVWLQTLNWVWFEKAMSDFSSQWLFNSGSSSKLPIDWRQAKVGLCSLEMWCNSLRLGSHIHSIGINNGKFPHNNVRFPRNKFDDQRLKYITFSKLQIWGWHFSYIDLSVYSRWFNKSISGNSNFYFF